MDCISEGSDNILRSRIEDTVRLCEKRGVPCFLGFLDLHEQAVAQQFLNRFRGDFSCSFYGGFADAERAFLSVSPSYYTAEAADYPFTCIAFTYRVQKKISHRDVLGTLMSLGITRDSVGDILCGDGLSVAFVRQEVTQFVCEQVDRVGGEGVSVICPFEGALPISIKYEEIRATVASPRLDGVIKALLHCSREQAAEYISRGLVSVNHCGEESVSKPLNSNDTISIRGYGRYIIDQIGPETKKGRLLLCARHRL